jgi:RNA polymerase sigma factor (sigma-70 family)
VDRPGLQVIDGGAEGDLQSLYRRYAGQVFGRCRYLLGDAAEAEDATQEVFARALVNLEGFRREASPLTWLMKIATHHCLNLLRANRALWRDEVKRIALVAPTTQEGPDQRELVRSLLARFDVETQACAVHYLVDEMSQEEVAALVGLSVPTVRKRVRTFMAAARDALTVEEA